MSWTPISYEAIAAWSTMTGVKPSPFEVQLIRRIDMTAAKMAAEASAARG